MLNRQAIRAAVERKVHIISMSWTIERTEYNREGIQGLETALSTAAEAGILMFCAASDQGKGREESFPSACSLTTHIFRIGAAEASGMAWKWVTSNVDFILPGHNIVPDHPRGVSLDRSRMMTGSSAATAIAAGLSALVLYCVQLGALHTEAFGQQQSHRTNTVKRIDFDYVKTHDGMSDVFTAIGTSQDSSNKYIEVWQTFESAPKMAVGADNEKKLEIVTEIAERLKSRLKLRKALRR